MTSERRYGPADWTVDEVLRTHADHTLQHQLALRVRELEGVIAMVRDALGRLKVERDRHWSVEHSATHDAIGDALEDAVMSIDLVLPEDG